VDAVLAQLAAVFMPIYDAFPEESGIHIFTCILVITGVLTLFISPAFRSKLSEMRVRPPVMQNGIIDAMAAASDRYNVIRDDLLAPRETCVESHFRCEYYWTSDTNGATDTSTTYYCTAYVCQVTLSRTRPCVRSGASTSFHLPLTSPFCRSAAVVNI
jgi:hypothetical protein